MKGIEWRGMMGNVSMIDGHIDEPRMTDDEIIRVLKHIVGLYDKDLTTICGIRLATLCGDALDLINRQNAEIEEYKYALEEIKAEATKEFAERFYSLLAEYEDYDTLHIYEIKDRIDLVKEMVGDAE
jgi:hypothetical protein